MAASGVSFNGTVMVGDSPDAASLSLVAAAARVPGFRVASEPGSIVLTRRYRPTWTIVVAILGALFLLFGLLVLLYQPTETLTLTLAQAEGGTRITISGVAASEMVTTLNATLASMKPPSEPAGTP